MGSAAPLQVWAPREAVSIFPSGKKINIGLEASRHWTWIAKREQSPGWQKQWRWGKEEIVEYSDEDTASEHDGP